MGKYEAGRGVSSYCSLYASGWTTGHLVLYSSSLFEGLFWVTKYTKKESGRTKRVKAKRKKRTKKNERSEIKGRKENHKTSQVNAWRLIWTRLLMVHLAIRKWNGAKLLMSQLMRMLVSHLDLDLDWERARPFQVVFELRGRMSEWMKVWERGN